MKKILFVILMLLCATAMFGQAANFSWVASPSNVSGYNLYRIQCGAGGCPTTCPGAGFTKVNFSVITGLTFKDATISYNQKYAYCATSVSTTCCLEGVGTPVLVVDMTQPAPPSGFAITQLAMNTTGGTSIVAAAYTAPSKSTYRLVSDKGVVLQMGDLDAGGSISWMGKKVKFVTLTVYDSTGKAVATKTTS